MLPRPSLGDAIEKSTCPVSQIIVGLGSDRAGGGMHNQNRADAVTGTSGIRTCLWTVEAKLWSTHTLSTNMQSSCMELPVLHARFRNFVV